MHEADIDGDKYLTVGVGGGNGQTDNGFSVFMIRNDLTFENIFNMDDNDDVRLKSILEITSIAINGSYYNFIIGNDPSQPTNKVHLFRMSAQKK